MVDGGLAGEDRVARCHLFHQYGMRPLFVAGSKYKRGAPIWGLFLFSLNREGWRLQRHLSRPYHLCVLDKPPPRPSWNIVGSLPIETACETVWLRNGP